MRVALAELLRARGDHASAVAHYEAAFALTPPPPAARLNLAFSLIALERGADAEREARAAMSALGSIDAPRALAGALALQGRRDETLAVLDAALANAGDARAQRLVRIDRAGALHHGGRTDEAVAEFAALRGEAPLPASALAAWAQAHFEAGDLTSAERVLRDAIAAQPGDPRHHRTLANVHWMSGRDIGACVTDLVEAIAARPADWGLRETHAMLLAAMGDLAGAEQVVRAALAEAGEHMPLYSALGFVQDEQGRIDAAVATLAHAMTLAPDDEARSRFAHALLRAGDGEHALAIIEELLRRAPLDQIHRAFQAMAWRMLGDPRFGAHYDVARFVRAVDLAPPPGFASMEAFNAALGARLDGLHRLAAHPLNQTLRHGTQTGRDLTEESDPVIRAFLEIAKTAVLGFVADLQDDPAHPFLARKSGDVRFAGAWSVRLRPGGAHVNHVHPKGWISSAYYVRVPQPRTADAAHAGWLKFGEPRLPMPGCAPLHWIEPKPGRLALFPSYMWHGTEPFDHDDRLTIAFDMVPA
jgi:tetratricopeptide (TPR) repeat protein